MKPVLSELAKEETHLYHSSQDLVLEYGFRTITGGSQAMGAIGVDATSYDRLHVHDVTPHLPAPHLVHNAYPEVFPRLVYGQAPPESRDWAWYWGGARSSALLSGPMSVEIMAQVRHQLGDQPSLNWLSSLREKSASSIISMPNITQNIRVSDFRLPPVTIPSVVTDLERALLSSFRRPSSSSSAASPASSASPSASLGGGGGTAEPETKETTTKK